MLHGCETWTLLTAEINKLKASEMWIWRRLETVSWKERINNEQALTMVNETKCLDRRYRPKEEELYVKHARRI